MNSLILATMLATFPSAYGAGTSTTATSSVADAPPPTAEVVPTPPKKEKPASVLPPSISAKFHAQYWARFVGNGGRGFVSSPFVEYVGQRARLGATLSHDSGLAVSVMLQDVRTWGEESNTLNDFSADGFDLQQAYVDIPIFDLAKARIGRQEVVIGNARLIGNVAWLLRARSFDGARVNMSTGELKSTLFYAKVTERDPNGDGNVAPNVATDRDLALAHFEYALGKKNKLTFSYIFDHTANGARKLHTLGPVFTGKTSAFDYTAEAFLQVGEIADVKRTTFLLSGQAGYTFDVPTKPRLFAFVDVLSSDDGAVFDTLYATNHKFYGEMDLFLNLPAHTSGLGLINPGVGVVFSPLKRLKVKLTYFDFLAFKAHDPLGRRFGDEIDLKVFVKILDSVQLRALYGVFIPANVVQARFGPAADRVAHLFFATLAAQL